MNKRYTHIQKLSLSLSLSEELKLASLVSLGEKN